MRLYSYVVDHDNGISPNPANGLCTLVHCKYNRLGRKRNIVEMIEEGDWLLGSGGASKQSAGAGNIIYLMRIDKKLDFAEYMRNPKYAGRIDRFDLKLNNRYALVSQTYFYFGSNAISVKSLPEEFGSINLFKSGQGYRKDLPASQIESLVKWITKEHGGSPIGDPCAPDPKLKRSNRSFRICKLRRNHNRGPSECQPQI